MVNKGAPTVCSPQVKGKMRRKHPGGDMHHRCTLAGLPASMAFRWRKSPCRPSLIQKNTASRGRMAQICGKSKKSEQARAGAWGTGSNADNGSEGAAISRGPAPEERPGSRPRRQAKRVSVQSRHTGQKNAFRCSFCRRIGNETGFGAVGTPSTPASAGFA